MKKKFSIFIIFFVLTASIFAMPYFSSFLPDNSGEYVYYKDNSFVRESYVGFLYYDDSTFQLRYFAPEDKINFLPEKNIVLYVTVNPQKENLEMTGELISSTILPETDDSNLVNYLHDIFYEFTSRRIKTENVNPNDENYVFNGNYDEDGLKIHTDFLQFGGNVTIIYDAMIPLFNIKKIIGEDGNAILECATIGQLKDSNDTNFSDFKGFPPEQEKSQNSKQTIKKAKKQTQNFENQTISLDENWSSKMENFWTLGDESLITLTKIPELNADEKLNSLYILRKLSESSNSNFVDFQDLEILYDKKKNQYKITSKNYLPEREKQIITTKILTKDKNSTDFYYFSISVYDFSYSQNRAYFDKIIKSYKIKN